jgi:hypothetical protein
MALSIEQVAARVESLRFRASDRDARNLDVPCCTQRTNC